MNCNHNFNTNNKRCTECGRYVPLDISTKEIRYLKKAKLNQLPDGSQYQIPLEEFANMQIHTEWHNNPLFKKIKTLHTCNFVIYNQLDTLAITILMCTKCGRKKVINS